MKASITHYWKPTPIFWRKIGDSMLVVGALSGTLAIAEDMKWLSISLVVCTLLGKFLTNFFKKDER